MVLLAVVPSVMVAGLGMLGLVAPGLLLGWWAAQSALFMRLRALLALAIGLGLVYALLV